MFIRTDRRRASDAGFTLIEVLVGLTILAIVAAGLVPLLLAGLRASQLSRTSTLAKNLGQQRIEAMRSLPFHVDAQNGPYVDLLDLYYHDTSGSSSSLQHVVPGQTVTGQYVAAGGGAGPSGPYYKVVIPQGLLGSPYQNFNQTVYSQFLEPDEPAATALSASRLGSTYNNSTVGQDSPPSLLLGVTVVTTWTSHGTTKTSSTFTEITDTGATSSLITSQARTVALDILSKDASGNLLEMQAGVVNTDGSLSNGSSAGTSAVGASATRSDLTTDNVSGAQASAESPPNPSVGGSGGGVTAGATQLGTTPTSCGWGFFGPTSVQNVSSTTAGGLPLAPQDAGTTNPTTKVAANITANNGGSCSGLGFTNLVDSGGSADSLLQIPSDSPIVVKVQDLTGNAPEVSGSAYVAANTHIGQTGSVTAGSGVAFSAWTKLFPGLPFLANTNAPSELGSSPGLFNVKITSASLACSAGAAPTLAYTGKVDWYTASGWHTANVNFTSGTDTLAQAVDLTQKVTTYNGVDIPLSAYISSLSSATGVTTGSGTGDNGNVSSVQAVVSILTAPIRGVSDPDSAVGLQIGRMSCTAQDFR